LRAFMDLTLESRLKSHFSHLYRQYAIKVDIVQDMESKAGQPASQSSSSDLVHAGCLVGRALLGLVGSCSTSSSATAGSSLAGTD
jgi:hypothetical protein